MNCIKGGNAAAGGDTHRYGSPSRRRLLCAGSLALAAGLRRPAAAADKISKEAAKYQDMPKGEQRCEICLQFRPPHQCQLVRGTIARNGWCQFFAAKENAR